MIGFEFLGTKIFFSEGMQNYASVHKLFAGLAVKGSKQFRRELNELKNLDEMVQRVGEIASDAISIGLTEGMQHLLRNDVFTVDIDTYAEMFVPYCMPLWLNAYEQFEEAYSSIVCTQQEIEEYRRIRKESRTKFVGGGFGVKNAVSGAVKAEVLNGITGTAHSLVNAIGNAKTNSQTEKEKQKLFHSAEMRELLVNGVYSSIYTLMFVNMHIITEETGVHFLIPEENDSDKAHAIVQNLNGNLIPEDKVNQMLAKAMQLDPSLSNIYFIALCKNGDVNKEIEKIADFMGIYINGKNIYEVKERLIYEEVKDKIVYMTANRDDEECVNVTKKEIEKVFQYYGVEQSETLEKYIQAPLEYLDAKKRTVDGVVYETMEQAQAVRCDKEKIEQILDSKNLDTISGYNEALEELKQMQFFDSHIKNDIENILKHEQKVRSKSLYTIGCRMVEIEKEAFTIRETGKGYPYNLYAVIFVGTNYKFKDVVRCWKEIYKLEEQEEFLVYINSGFEGQESKTNGIILTNLYLLLHDRENVNIKIPLSEVENVRGHSKDEIIVDISGNKKAKIIIRSSRHEETIERLANCLLRMIEVAKSIKGEFIEYSEQEIEARREKNVEMTDEIKAEYRKACKIVADEIQSLKGFGKEMWRNFVATNDGSIKDFEDTVKFICDLAGFTVEKDEFPLMYMVAIRTNTKTKVSNFESGILITTKRIYVKDEEGAMTCQNIKNGFFSSKEGLFKSQITYEYRDKCYKVKYLLKTVDAWEFSKKLGRMRGEADKVFEKYAK